MEYMAWQARDGYLSLMVVSACLLQLLDSLFSQDCQLVTSRFGYQRNSMRLRDREWLIMAWKKASQLV